MLHADNPLRESIALPGIQAAWIGPVKLRLVITGDLVHCRQPIELSSPREQPEQLTAIA